MAEKKEKEAGKDRYIVQERFIDADEYVVDGVKNTYEPKADVSHFDKKRLEDLQDRKLVKKVSE